MVSLEWLGSRQFASAGRVSGELVSKGFAREGFVAGHRFSDGITRSKPHPLLGAALAIALTAMALFPNPALADSGADIYKAKCASCHAASGAGDTMLGKNMKLRPLASSEVQQQSDEELASIIGKGKNRMPAYGRKLSPQQIEDVVKHIRSLKK